MEKLEYTHQPGFLELRTNNPHDLWKIIDRSGWQILKDVKVVVLSSQKNPTFLVVDPDFLQELKKGEFLTDNQTVKKEGGDIPTFDKIFGENSTLLNTADPAFWKEHREAMNKVLSAIQPEGLFQATQQFTETVLKSKGEHIRVPQLQNLLSTWTHQGLGNQVVRADLSDNPEKILSTQKKVNLEVVVAVLTRGLITIQRHRRQIADHLNAHVNNPELKATLDTLSKIIVRAGLATEPTELYVKTAEIAGIASTDTTLSAALYTMEQLALLETTHPEFFEQMKSEVQDFFESGKSFSRKPPETVQSFVLEALRCARVVQYSPIMAAKNIAIPDTKFHIPQGSQILPMYSLISENPLLWGEKEAQFKPDRFMNHLQQHSITISDHLINKGLPYFVFASESRDCIGRTKAILALNILVSSFIKEVLTEYKIEKASIRRRVVTGLTVATPIDQSELTLHKRA
jgi:cytochrome P450